MSKSENKSINDQGLHEQNLETLNKNLDELVKTHPNEYVLIVEGQIVGFAANEKLLQPIIDNFSGKEILIYYLIPNSTLRREIRSPKAFFPDYPEEPES